MAPSSTSSSAAPPLNPVTKEFEWFGPIGATFLVLSLPLTTIVLNALCGPDACDLLIADFMTPISNEIARSIPALPWVLAVETAWILFHCVFYLLPIGERVKGGALRNGKKLTYNMNAIHAFFICHAFVLVTHLAGLVDYAIIADEFLAFVLGACIISVVLSVFLYAFSFRSSNVLLALGGNTGSAIYDFWVGRELNPRIGELDLKFMFELRPGLIGWCLFNWCFVIKAFNVGQWCPALIFVAIFQSWYVADGLFVEEGNLTMMDIVHDGFGFMLAFGDLAWVPGLYTLQCRFLMSHPQHHPMWYLALGVAVQLLGYIIFRGANSDKDRFRKNPKDPRVAHLQVMKTSAGKSLIISGYWGICRHPNYVGDWMMTLAQSMLCGAGHLLPYFQPVYFAILLIHRQLRDEHHMLHKYGEEDWKKFCGIVKYRLIPYIY